MPSLGGRLVSHARQSLLVGWKEQERTIRPLVLIRFESVVDELFVSC